MDRLLVDGNILGGEIFLFFINCNVMFFCRVEKHVLINRDDQPCTDYETQKSSFPICIAKYAVNMTGCRVSLFEFICFLKYTRLVVE